MSEQTDRTLTFLEATQLFRAKQPSYWTEADLAAFRDRLEQSSGLLSLLGGQQEVDRRLAEVAAALATASEQPAERDASTGDVAARSPAAQSSVLAPTVVAILLFALFAGVGGWFYSVWPETELDNTTVAEVPLDNSEHSQPPEQSRRIQSPPRPRVSKNLLESKARLATKNLLKSRKMNPSYQLFKERTQTKPSSTVSSTARTSRDGKVAREVGRLKMARSLAKKAAPRPI